MSFDSIIQNDAFDHITRNILSNLDSQSIDQCRTVCKRLNKVLMEDEYCLDKLIMRVRFVRCLVHPMFKAILQNIKDEGISAKKMKLAKMLVNFRLEEIRNHYGFNLIDSNNFYLSKISKKF